MNLQSGPNPSIEFGIEKPPAPRSDGHMEVAGRVHRGPIPVGGIFLEALEVRKWVDRPYEVLGKSKVHLEVKSIRAYGRDLDEIHEGMTCILVLAGRGDALRHDSVLVGGLAAA
jgi:hypothetical protein